MRNARSGRGERRFGYRGAGIRLVVVGAVAAAGATATASTVGAAVAAAVDAGVIDVANVAISDGRLESRNARRAGRRRRCAGPQPAAKIL